MAHALALESDKAGGERFIVSNGPFAWQKISQCMVPELQKLVLIA